MLNPVARQDFTLRRSFRNYAIGVAAAALLSVGVVARVISVRDWRLLETLEIVWVMVIVWVYIGLRHQVLWRQGAIEMRALGRPDTRVTPDEIMSMAIDTAERIKIAGLGKPADRIKVVGRAADGAVNSVYISLGHFLAADVHRLLMIVADERPDLPFPRSWLQRRAAKAGKEVFFL